MTDSARRAARCCAAPGGRSGARGGGWTGLRPSLAAFVSVAAATRSARVGLCAAGEPVRRAQEPVEAMAAEALAA